MSPLCRCLVDEGAEDLDDNRFFIGFNDRLDGGFDNGCGNVRHALVYTLLYVPRLSPCLSLLARELLRRSLKTDKRCGYV